jgi:CBS domain-containing protein
MIEVQPPPEGLMSTVRDLLARRSTPVLSIAPDATVLEAAELMAANGIGGLPVLEGDVLAGIFTERDILQRVVARQLEPVHTRVSDVMTAPVLTCTPATSVTECAAIMDARGLRHLPVMEGRKLVGMISVRDLVAWRIADQASEIADLNRYVAGSY